MGKLPGVATIAAPPWPCANLRWAWTRGSEVLKNKSIHIYNAVGKTFCKIGFQVNIPFKKYKQRYFFNFLPGHFGAVIIGHSFVLGAGTAAAGKY